TLTFFRQSGSFVVNILTEQQEYLSRCFATPSQERYKHFCSTPYHYSATGSPVLDSALAFVDARIVAEYPGGDHIIFIGQVEAMGVGDQVAFSEDAGERHSSFNEYGGNTEIDDKAAPLVYYRGQYRHLNHDYQRPSLARHYDEKDTLKVR